MNTLTNSLQRLAGATVLIFANKQDVNGAMTQDEIKDVSIVVPSTDAQITQQTLQLDSIKTHTWKIQSCSAVTGEHLLEGLDWAVADCSKRLYYSSEPDFTTKKDLPKLFKDESSE